MRPLLALLLCAILLALSACSSPRICTRAQVDGIKRAAHLQGVKEGRAIEVRNQELQCQAELEKPQPASKFYTIPVPAHTTADGVNIDAHESVIEIITR